MADATDEKRLELTGSRQLPAWMAEHGLSLAFSTYQVGKLFLVGLQESGRLSIFERTFNRAMGLCAAGDQLYLATLFQLWRFDDVAAAGGGAAVEGHDRVYVPQLAWTTGDLDIHEVAVGADGVVFANTLFSCLARPSAGYSFAPVWQPPFISRLAAEDRCHLNGLAMRDGRPAFVTAVSQSDVGDGWRDRRRDGGVVVDVGSGEVVVEGLSMPHSPRWHDGRLWLLNSGTGWLGRVDLTDGRFEPVGFCPGYGRGLSFVGDFAVVGLSKPRHNATFTGLDLDDELKRHDAEARCGLWVVDLRSGDAVHWLRIEGIVDELFDVAILAQTRRPALIGLKTDEIRRIISMAPVAAEARA